MNKTQKKKTATQMRHAFEIERDRLSAKGFLIATRAIDDYLKTATDDSLVKFADELHKAKVAIENARRV